MTTIAELKCQLAIRERQVSYLAAALGRRDHGYAVIYEGDKFVDIVMLPRTQYDIFYPPVELYPQAVTCECKPKGA